MEIPEHSQIRNYKNDNILITEGIWIRTPAKPDNTLVKKLIQRKSKQIDKLYSKKSKAKILIISDLTVEFNRNS